MLDYVYKMILEFLQEHWKDTKITSPWSQNLIQVNEASPLLTKNMSEQFRKSTVQRKTL
jgi:hypothetical protein